MQNVAQPYRSVLYIPGSKTRALEKAQSIPVDAIIFDLEDAVSPDEKVAARKLLAETLRTTDYGPRKRIVRVNGGDTEWGADDLAAFIDVAPDVILLPKVEEPAIVAALSGRVKGSTSIWAMMETPRGILNAAAIAAAPKMEGFVMARTTLPKTLALVVGLR